MEIDRSSKDRPARELTSALALTLGLWLGGCSSGSEPASGGGGGGGGAAEQVARGELVLVGAEPFLTTGEPGGPFVPQSRRYTARNVGGSAITWTATCSRDWLVVRGQTSGTLLPGQEVEVEVAHEPAVANGLSIGDYRGEVRFNDASNGTFVSVLANLIVLDPAGSLTVDPIDRIEFTGPLGGPFLPDLHVYTLTNQGTGSVDWTAAVDQPWLVLSTASGTIGANASVQILASLDQAAAQGMASGGYDARVDFSNTTNGSGDTSREVELTILGPPQARLRATPNEGFVSAGSEGGPFEPSEISYTLNNTGTLDLGWIVSVSESWLEIDGFDSGTLPPDTSTSVTVGLSSAAAGLPAGLHGGSIEFINTTDGFGTTSLGAHLSVSSIEGWTEFAPSIDSKLVHVSSSQGDDGNDGLSELAPKRTIQAGLDEMREGFPDWLLLRKGDVWNESPQFGFRWTTAGRSPNEPTLVSSYGPVGAARPLILTEGEPGIRIMGMPHIKHVAIVGIEFDAGHRDPVHDSPFGAYFTAAISDILVENCKFTGFTIGISAELGPLENFRFRRNVIVDSYDTVGGHSQGIFVRQANNLLVEGNVLDHAGWSEVYPDATLPTMFKHGAYIQQDCTNVVFRGNIVSDSAAAGVQLRSGGVLHDNLLLQNMVSAVVGGGTAPVPGGVTADVQRNVVLDGEDHIPGAAHSRKHGFEVQNMAEALFRHNIVANQAPGDQARGFSLSEARHQTNGQVFGMRNTVFEENIVYDWSGRCVLVGDFSGSFFTDITFLKNDFQHYQGTRELVINSEIASALEMTMSENRYHHEHQDPSQWMAVQGVSYSLPEYLALVGDATSVALQVTYPDPVRTIATYHASIGGAPSHEAFIARAVLQSKDNWDPRYTAEAVNEYIRAGFGLEVD